MSLQSAALLPTVLPGGPPAAGRAEATGAQALPGRWPCVWLAWVWGWRLVCTTQAPTGLYWGCSFPVPPGHRLVSSVRVPSLGGSPCWDLRELLGPSRGSHLPVPSLSGPSSASSPSDRRRKAGRHLRVSGRLFQRRRLCREAAVPPSLSGICLDHRTRSSWHHCSVHPPSGALVLLLACTDHHRCFEDRTVWAPSVWPQRAENVCASEFQITVPGGPGRAPHTAVPWAAAVARPWVCQVQRVGLGVPPGFEKCRTPLRGRAWVQPACRSGTPPHAWGFKTDCDVCSQEVTSETLHERL